ncbi:MAG TPA: ATP-binding cassette domain-containing protein [Solirubrobacteraceae bacterium]|nr:ATP-binding cassette domain-containing protein [Solirubrobacteraceae bacterium]
MPSTSSTEGLEIASISCRYGDVVALDGLSFVAARGRICGFVGRNGAGKTSAIRIILGLVAPAAGEVRWQGRPARAAERAGFGYMPERRALYVRMRVEDQLVYFARLRGLSRADGAAAAGRWIERLGLGDRARDRIWRLSLGEQQLVQFAAALVHDPVLLLLDEPFSGLDAFGVDVMAEILRERAALGAAVLFSSHQLDVVDRVCDDVAVLRSGRIAAAGQVGDLRVRRGRGAWRVVVDGAGDGWIAGVAGASVVDASGPGLLVALPAGTDEQTLLDAARAAGRVTHFAREQPTLAEVFKDVVGA